MSRAGVGRVLIVDVMLIDLLTELTLFHEDFLFLLLVHTNMAEAGFEPRS